MHVFSCHRIPHLNVQTTTNNRPPVWAEGDVSASFNEFMLKYSCEGIPQANVVTCTSKRSSVWTESEARYLRILFNPYHAVPQFNSRHDVPKMDSVGMIKYYIIIVYIYFVRSNS